MRTAYESMLMHLTYLSASVLRIRTAQMPESTKQRTQGEIFNGAERSTYYPCTGDSNQSVASCRHPQRAKGPSFMG
jgi:hypothetical protein